MCKLEFGIPSLDELISPELGLKFDTGIEPGVVCIMGPDGVGKSVLALHLASNFWRQQQLNPATNSPAIFYFSTDLKYAQASSTWAAFGLNLPVERRLALQDLNLFGPLRDANSKSIGELQLQCIEPISEDDIPSTQPRLPNVAYLDHLLNSANWEKEVQFVDLATRSAGDDWHLINRLTGFLAGLVTDNNTNNTNQPTAPRQHLIIVDAVEGLEALVGHHDVFGHARDRRSRVAQLARLAKKANAHLVFIIEEIRTDIRLPEEFVADLVIRLRSVKEKDYDRRTLEIEKARGVAHVRGQHDISLRQKIPQVNEPSMDNPGVSWPYFVGPPPPPASNSSLPATTQLATAPTAAIADDDSAPSTSNPAQQAAHSTQTAPNNTTPTRLAYVQIFKSLHARRRRKASAPPNAIAPSGSTAAKFFTTHLEHLNYLLEPPDDPRHVDSKSKLTALLGDSGTFKGRLGRNFLAQAFADPNSANVAILITLKNTPHEQIGKSLIEHLTDASAQPGSSLEADLHAKFKQQLLVRPIASHYLTSSGLFHMLDIYVKIAQNFIAASPEPGEIRFVLDDWNGLLAAHPNLAADSLLLQSLQEFIEDNHLNGLIISTQPGTPSQETNGNISHDLRSLDTRHIYTWPVPFFGTRRVAVTTYPPASIENPPLIYELSPQKTPSGELGDERLEIDRHFSLYSGLESGEPQRIPLKIRLYAGYHAHPEIVSAEQSYITQVQNLFGDISPPPKGEATVVTFDHVEHYLDMKDSIQFQDDRRLDHTLVLQVDEFWAQTDERLLFDLKRDYVEEVTSRELVDIELKQGETSVSVTWSYEPIKDADPHEAYQPLTPRNISDLNLWPDLQSYVIPVTNAGQLAPLPGGLQLHDDFIKSITQKLSPQAAPAGNPAPPQTPPQQVNKGEPHWQLENQSCTPANNSNPPSGNNPPNPPPPLRKLRFVRTRERQSFLHSLTDTTPHGTPQLRETRRLIPYLWDFGFILARRDLWWQARDRIVEIDDATSGSHEVRPVKEIWDALCIEKARFEKRVTDPPPPQYSVSWQLFLKACQVVRGGLEIPMFDADLRTETMNSLVLEIWYSEIVRTNPDEFTDASGKSPRRSLRSLLQNYALELYSALSLLFEYLPEIEVHGAELQLRSANHESVAARHWYSTANIALDKNPQYVPLANPGYWSARGDWSLSVSASSRSQLLGQRAIDRLTSRQMNILRLHDGMGLPVRDIIHDDLVKELRTSLKYYNPDRNEQELILLDSLTSLGAKELSNAQQASLGTRSPNYQRRWLWRSSLQGYSRQSFYFYRWLARVFQHRIDCFPVEQKARASIQNAVLARTYSTNAGETREHLFRNMMNDQQAKLRNARNKVGFLSGRDPLLDRVPDQRTGKVADAFQEKSEAASELIPFNYIQHFLNLRDIEVGILREDQPPENNWIELS